MNKVKTKKNSAWFNFGLNNGWETGLDENNNKLESVEIDLNKQITKIDLFLQTELNL